ncbi:MAG: glycosyltransferase family 9 protein [Planctomycetaceae bacterium]|nr:glycosyltransferase family 9 protein [Planctomycetaceae bacterium]
MDPNRTSTSDSPMRVLVVKPSSLGDIIHALPVAQSIRDQCPDAVISWVVKKRFEDVVRRCPTVNGEIFVFDHERGARGLWETCRQLRSHQFDYVLDLQGLLRSGLMTWAARSPARIGPPYAREGSRWFHHRTVSWPATGRLSHVIEMMLQFLPQMNLKPELRSPIVIQGDDPAEVDGRLRGIRPVLLLPNSRNADREWPRFPELTAQLIRTCPDLHVVWDSHKVWESPKVSDPQRFINLTSKTSLMQLVELIRSARLVIANDSGPLHMAAALGTPTLGIYGPTFPEHTGPYPLDSIRNSAIVAPNRKLHQLSSDAVLKTAQQILGRLNVQSKAA